MNIEIVDDTTKNEKRVSYGIHLKDPEKKKPKWFLYGYFRTLKDVHDTLVYFIKDKRYIGYKVKIEKCLMTRIYTNTSKEAILLKIKLGI